MTAMGAPQQNSCAPPAFAYSAGAVRFEAERNHEAVSEYASRPAIKSPVPVSLLCLRSFNAFPRLDGGYAPDTVETRERPLCPHTSILFLRARM